MGQDKIIFPKATQKDFDDAYAELNDKLMSQRAEKYDDGTAKRKHKIAKFLVVLLIVCVMSLIFTIMYGYAVQGANGGVLTAALITELISIVSLFVSISILIKRSNKGTAEELAYSEFENADLPETVCPDYLEGLEDIKKNLNTFDSVKVEIGDLTNVLIKGIVNGHSVMEVGFKLEIDEFKKMTAAASDGVYDFSFIDEELAELRSSVERI